MPAMVFMSFMSILYIRASQTGGRDPLGGGVMMFRDRIELINFTQSTAYTIVSVVAAHTILHIL